MRRNAARDALLRARARVEDGEVALEAVTGQESHMIARAAGADALVLVPRGDGELAAGSAVRYLSPGHVAAVLAGCRRLELARLLDRVHARERSLVLAMVVQRLLEPGSKLACARALGQSTLAEELGVGGATEDELYAALDWLEARQERIDDRLARRHLRVGEVALYDLSSSYFEGRTCPLAALGYSRDGRRGTLEIVYGLLTDRAGRPVCVEVFDAQRTITRPCPPSSTSSMTASASLSSSWSLIAAW